MIIIPFVQSVDGRSELSAVVDQVRYGALPVNPGTIHAVNSRVPDSCPKMTGPPPDECSGFDTDLIEHSKTLCAARTAGRKRCGGIFGLPVGARRSDRTTLRCCGPRPNCSGIHGETGCPAVHLRFHCAVGTHGDGYEH